MRIAFITIMGGSPWGGSEVLWSEAALQARRDGHEVFFAAFAYPERPAPIRALLELGATGHFRPTYSPAMSVRVVRRFRNLARGGDAELKALQDFRPDRIVISQGSSYDLLHYPGLQDYVLRAGIPYFVICHNYNEGLALQDVIRERLLQVFRAARQVFMICDAQREAIQEQLLCRLSNMSIVNNPLNIATPEILGPPRGRTVMFASVASMHLDRKGQDLLFNAFSRPQWKERDWKLNLYGNGPDRECIERLARYHNLAERTVFHGHVASIRAVWESNHMLVLSSRIETGPMALLEAMLCGRPVVTTQVGKVRELIRDGVEGFVAPAATADLLAAALDRAWQSRDSWTAMGAAAFRAAGADADPKAAATFLKKVTAG
jgi:glycosyltransferase involved in cell wall biosynthesis